MPYTLNGTAMDPQPTTGDWVLLDALDDDGNGRPIYSALMDFVMTWQLADTAMFNSILNQWSAASASGSVVAGLPKYGQSTYVFYSYSGTYPERPTIDAYFEQYHTNIKMVIRNVRPLAVPIS